MNEASPLHLLDALTEHDGFDTAVYFTFGVDLAFFEEAVLRPLRHKGIRRHIVFMDGRRYADTIRHWRGCAEAVGQHYLLVPVDLPPFQAFHPKLTLLIGPERGRLLVGSGNLTFTGFGQNRELYTCLDWTAEAPETSPLFRAAWQFIMAVQKQWGHNRLVDEVLRKAQYHAYWLNHTAGAPAPELAFWHSLQTPILAQLAQALRGETVRRITIVTPFLDAQAAAVAELYRLWQPAAIRLALQDGQAVGDIESLGALQAQGMPLTIHRFGEDGRYLHAKLLLLETKTAAYALSGSANCTRPALLATPETGGNVETVLLRRAETPDYFAYLLPAELMPAPVSLSEISLRSGRLPAEATDAATALETAVPPIRLLDLTVQGEQLEVLAEQTRPLPAAITTLQLQLESMPPVYLPLPAGLDGRWQTAVPVTPDWQQRQPLVASIVGMAEDGHVVDVVSNSLWITQADALTQAARGRYAGGRVTPFLAGMLPESESDWADVYAEINRLVELDASRISRSVATSASQARATASASLPATEKETRITLAAADNRLEPDEAEQLETAVSRESELQAFFDHVRQRLPGQAATTTEATSSTTMTTGGSRSPWTPSRHAQTRFVNLVKKYIASLHNPEFMQQIPVNDSLLHYVIFQRIVWLLYTHHGLDVERYLDLLLALNSGFFGEKVDEPPVADLRLQRHLCHAVGESWLANDVPLYVLCMLWQAEQEVGEVAEDAYTNQWARCRQRILACLRTVVEWPSLRRQIEALTSLTAVAEMVGATPQDLALDLLPLLDADLLPQAEMLTTWCRRSAFDPQEMGQGREANWWYRANVDYRRALYELYAQQNNVAEQQRLAQELSFWARRAGAISEVHLWGERLVGLYRREGNDQETAVLLYQQAHRYFLDQEYPLATQFAQEALALAEQQADSKTEQKCRRLLDGIQFMAGLQ